jgi:hypothetical protein
VQTATVIGMITRVLDCITSHDPPLRDMAWPVHCTVSREAFQRGPLSTEVKLHDSD